MTLEDVRSSLDLYMRGYRPGRCLQAILENDLMGAISRADPETVANLQGICTYIFNELPSIAVGTPEKVSDWLAMPEAARRQIRGVPVGAIEGEPA